MRGDVVSMEIAAAGSGAWSFPLSAGDFVEYIVVSFVPDAAVSMAELFGFDPVGGTGTLNVPLPGSAGANGVVAIAATEHPARSLADVRGGNREDSVGFPGTVFSPSNDGILVPYGQTFKIPVNHVALGRHHFSVGVAASASLAAVVMIAARIERAGERAVRVAVNSSPPPLDSKVID